MLSPSLRVQPVRGLRRATLRPGNVHSADNWRQVLDPILARYERTGVRRYFDSILVRWHTGREKGRDRVMADLRRFREMGFNLIFFYPKWASKGYSAETADTATDPSRGTWHSFLQPNPGRGGWPALVQLAEEARSLDCVIHVFTRMISHDEGAPDFNTARLPRGEDGELTPVSRGASIYITHDEHERLVKTLDFIEERGLKLDTLYFDGYAAHAGGVEDYSPEHPVTRRRGYDLMNEAMSETRARHHACGGGRTVLVRSRYRLLLLLHGLEQRAP